MSGAAVEGKLCSYGHNCRRQNKFNLSFSFPKIVVSEERARKNRYSLEIQRQILKILHSLEFSLRESAMNSGSCRPSRIYDAGAMTASPPIMPSPTRSKCRLQALHGNEVYVIVLSYRNPSVRSKSFMLKSKASLITFVYNLLRFNGI
jgi:hypothetical protein